MIEQLFVSIVGGLTAALIVAVGGLVLMCWSYYRGRRYLGDGGVVAAGSAYVRNLPRYLYQATDWEQYARGVGYTFAVGFLVVFVGSLFYVGVTTIYW